jgi:hypothetical protein
LVREHTEKIRPPRALWVPFELGRPFGAPDEPAFQTRVLVAALGLFDAASGPVLEDFPADAPAAAESEGWACAIPIAAPAEDTLPASFVAEFERMRPWYDRAVEARRGTTYGASGLDLDGVADFLAACFEGSMEAPEGAAATSFPGMVKLASEDLKVVYHEAATAQPGKRQATALEVADWFWGETRAGALLLDLKRRYAESDDPAIRLLGNVLVVPVNQLHRVA